MIWLTSHSRNKMSIWRNIEKFNSMNSPKIIHINNKGKFHSVTFA